MDNNIISRKRHSTFAVTFFLNPSKTKKNGNCPVRGRIMVDTEKEHFSCKVDINPAKWDAKAHRAIGNGREAMEVNGVIERFTKEIRNYYDECLKRSGYVTAKLIKNRLKGIGKYPEYLLELFREHNSEYEKRVGVDRGEASLQTYLRSYKKLEEFIKRQYDCEDMYLKHLDQAFIEDYHLFLKIDKRLADKTILEHITHLRKITCRAKNQGTLMFDPFATYHVEQKPSPFRHLQADEMQRIMGTAIADPLICYFRDLFVFSCFTGLAFVDLCKLTEEHLRTEPDGSRWLHIKRTKSGIDCDVRLLKIPLVIIDKYSHERKGAKIFNIEYKERGKVPPAMRELEQACNVPHITFHVARHSILAFRLKTSELREKNFRQVTI